MASSGSKPFLQESQGKCANPYSSNQHYPLKHYFWRCALEKYFSGVTKEEGNGDINKTCFHQKSCMLIRNVLFWETSICRKNEMLQRTGTASKDLTCLKLQYNLSAVNIYCEEHIITNEITYIALLPLFLKSILHLTKILIVLLKVHTSDFVQRRKLIHK